MEVDLSWRRGQGLSLVEETGICMGGRGGIATVRKHSEISGLNKSFLLAHIKAAGQ